MITTNAMDQVTEMDGPLGEVVQFSHDAAGHVIIRQNKLGTSAWPKAASVYNDYEQLTASQAYSQCNSVPDYDLYL